MPLPRAVIEKLANRRSASAAAADIQRVLAALFEQGTFQEYGRYADHRVPGLGHAECSLPGDGVVTGVGYVADRPVAVFVQSAVVAEGSVGIVHADRIAALLDHAGRAGMPVVGILNSAGGRLEEGPDVLAGYGAVLSRLSALSGVVPVIVAVAGPCPGIGALVAGLADFVVMISGTAALYLTGPDVIAAVSGAAPDVEEIGGASVHAEHSGLAHLLASDVDEAVAAIRRLLGFLPANNRAAAPDRDLAEFDVAPDPVLDDMAPAAAADGYDAREVVGRIVDDADWLELQAGYGASLVVGFGRVGGLVAGVVASDPRQRAGTLDLAACDKAARFVRFCDAFGLPLVTLVDAPGFLPDPDQERMGLVRAAARLCLSFAEATVAKVTVVLGRAFGGAGLALGSRALGADVVFAWPAADIGLPGGMAAADIAARQPSPYLSDGRFTVADVVEPSRTKAAVALALRTLAAKRDIRPPRKHGTQAP